MQYQPAELWREAGRDIVIIDVSPGTSCPVVQSIKGSDFCLLVTEPTPFGLNDLILVLLTIPLDTEVACLHSRGITLAEGIRSGNKALWYSLAK